MTDFLSLHGKFEKRALAILLKMFRAQGRKIPFDNLTPANAEHVVLLNFDGQAAHVALFKIHTTIGKQYGLSIARELRRTVKDETKAFSPLPLFSEEFQRYLLAFYKAQGGDLIKLLSSTYAAAVVSEIHAATTENETLIQMRDRIYKTVNSPNFYKWQAMRIARTETTFAMNAGKVKALDSSGVIYDKVWIGAADARERPSHIALNDTLVPANDYFDLGDCKMLFPGDKSTAPPAREVVNCRCTWQYRARRDANGKLIWKI